MLLIVAALALCVALSMFVADKYLTNTGNVLESNSSDEDNIECAPPHNLQPFCNRNISADTKPRLQKSRLDILLRTTRYHTQSMFSSPWTPHFHQATTDHLKHLLKQATHDEHIEKTRAIAFKTDGTDVPPPKH
jgi:hypothetical protein